MAHILFWCNSCDHHRTFLYIVSVYLYATLLGIPSEKGIPPTLHTLPFYTHTTQIHIPLSLPPPPPPPPKKNTHTHTFIHTSHTYHPHTHTYHPHTHILCTCNMNSLIASTPYFSITSRGSTPLYLDFDIFSQLSSTPSGIPWRAACSSFVRYHPLFFSL